MAKARFTEEQIADFLRQSKSGVPNKELCEKYGFSVSTLRRWQELHAEGVRLELKQLESTAPIIYLGFIVVAVLLTLVFPKPTGALVIPPFIIYCIYYIRRFRRISAKHIKEENTFLARSGMGANNAFYKFCWAMIILLMVMLGYIITHPG
ncbi:transposase [Superficieibacter electus]|uniref:Transposase n=1 Tax=Superficieibacter electus TaxID=2022662 RepID=A0A2P5GQD3_9ENTR|nr:transposase [Superficieibacter electus]POP45588.1 transposase [Superficieibacter electus]POP48749.1 transposase [Superficieibacter electus]